MNGDNGIKRLEESHTGKKTWKKWEAYLSECQWGTVREDYSDNGDAWNYFTCQRWQFPSLDLQPTIIEAITVQGFNPPIHTRG